MRILFVSNFYPPHYYGGYELGCQDAVEGLKARGHQVRVLTSTYGVPVPQVDGEVHRVLQIHVGYLYPNTVLLREAASQAAFHQACAGFTPDVVFFWNLAHLSLSLTGIVARLGLPACYYVFDHWPAAWEIDSWYQAWHRGSPAGRAGLRTFSRMLKLMPPPEELDLRQAFFASRYLQQLVAQAGNRAAATVIPWGIDGALFPCREAASGPPTRLLFAGQIRPHKGPHTAVQALGLLAGRTKAPVTLTLVGDAEALPAYTAHLRELAERYGVAERVIFAGAYPRERLGELYRSNDVLLFPSIWAEPFGLTQLEAMACGLAVVGTGVGGSSEIVEDSVNALTFSPDNAEQCAGQLERLLSSPRLYQSLCENGRRSFLEKYQLSHALDTLEDALRGVVEDHTGRRPTMLPQPARVGRACTAALRLLSLPPKVSEQVGAAKQAVRRLDTRLLIGGQTAADGTTPPPLVNARSLLVVQLGNAADVVLSSALLRELRRSLPDAWIGLVVRPEARNIVEACPYVDRVLAFAPNHRGLASLKARRFAGAILRNRPIDLGLSLHECHDDTHMVSCLLLAASRAPVRVGYGSPGPDCLLTHCLSREFPQHAVERQLELLRFLGTVTGGTAPEVWATGEDDQAAAELLKGHGFESGEMPVMFAPDAVHPDGQWPVPNYVNLARWLQETYSARVLVVGEGTQAGLSAAIAHELGAGVAADLTGRVTLRQTAALLRRCRLLLGTDTAAMHVATATNTPVVGLFGPENDKRLRPLGPGCAVVRLELACRPCRGACLLRRPSCIEGISVEQVKAAVCSLQL